MGDFVHIESYGHRNVLNLTEALGKYLKQRKYLSTILHSIPFFLTLGNHEGEQGWRLADPSDSIASWGAVARKLVTPNPVPDGFYTGDSTVTVCCGCRGGYYSWEWGDALFIVLDPFWYTATKPHSNGGEGSNDPWDWTLGHNQYNWLYDTLHNSDATWRFVFIHHLAGGVLSPSGEFMTPYGRGGIEAAKYSVDERGSYEWGGENEDGVNVFASKRSGWNHGPIHDLMVNGNVTILFHGHDHVFVHQVLDGVVYQACPQPSDPDYGEGWYADGCYSLGEKRMNSGHLRLRVRPDYVQVDYVRSVLPEDAPLLEGGGPVYNGQVCYSYSIGTAAVEAGSVETEGPCLIGGRPNPSVGEVTLSLRLETKSDVALKIYDTEGRLIRALFDGALPGGIHDVRWDGRREHGGRVGPGVYFCSMRSGDRLYTRKLLLLP
jgi:hypothetical protein